MADSKPMLSSIPQDIAKITAPILFGPMINWALYGALCVQTYVYGYNFPDDSRYLKAFAYFVFLLETAQTALKSADVYFWFIAGFGDLDRLENSNFSPIDSPIMNGFISLSVQGFFCYRIWTLNKRALWFCLLIAFLTIAQAVGAVWGGIKAATLVTYAVVKQGEYLWLITSALTDILIAVVLTWLLWRMSSREGRYSHHIVPRVVRLTIETNTVTASVAVFSLVLYVAFPNEIYYTCPTGILGKLYSNTLFVTLNNRIYFRDHPPPLGLRDGNSIPCPCHCPACETATALPLPNFDFARTQPLPRSATTAGHNTIIRLDAMLPALPVDPEKAIIKDAVVIRGTD